MSSFDAIPEAKYLVDFDDVWAAFNRCTEYCGTRRALHLVLDHMGRLAWNTVFQSLEDEAAGERAYQEEQDDDDERPPEEPRGRTPPTVSKIAREIAIAAVSGARAAMARAGAGEEPDDEEDDEEEDE
jgi:hypothetical protein